jgi:hypothetical protein
MLRSSKKHLEESQVGYFEHARFAIYAAFLLVGAGLASIIHAFVPAWFKGTGAFVVIKLYNERLVNHPNTQYQKWIKDGVNNK